MYKIPRKDRSQRIAAKF